MTEVSVKFLVFPRFRPDETGEVAVKFHNSGQKVKVGDKEYAFERIFALKSSQEELYEMIVPTIDGLIEGFNGTVICFGKPGCGVSYTSFGNTKSWETEINPADGIFPRAVRYVNLKMIIPSTRY